MPTDKKRTPGTHNASPLAPPPAAGSEPPKPLGTSTSPLTSNLRFKRQPSDNPVWTKIQSLSADQRVFLAPNFESVSKKLKKLDYYNIIFLFNPRTESRPTHTKDALKQAFLDNVRPLIQPYILPATPVRMETDASEVDFDPLNRKTTKAMLSKAIHQKAPKCNIPTTATIEDTLIAYKYHVDPQLPLPAPKRFIKRPRTIPLTRLQHESIEDILLALRYFAPCVFVRSLAMTKSCLMDIYAQFVHDEEPSSPLIPGYHYTILDLSPSDFQIQDSSF